MKTYVRLAALALSIATLSQTGLAGADEFLWISSEAKTAGPAGTEKTAPAANSPCATCCQAQCCDEECRESCCGADLGCDGCPLVGVVGFAGLDSFKGISDGSFPGNFGAVTGLNAGVPIPGLREYGLGWQLGMSYGVYDFDGRASTAINPTRTQQQTFLTMGIFRKASEDQRVSFGLVYDYMFNDQWGEFGNTNPTLGQWRGQIEYALSGNYAVGLWGCQRDRGSEQPIRTALVVTRPISQVNVFVHHKFDMGADGFVWFGVPDHGRINGDGGLGDWMVGANVQVPLSDRFALYANGSYFRPSAGAGATAAIESGYDVSMGVAWYFGRHAISHSINGGCWTPYMPVGNNSTFLVEQNPTF